MNARLYSLLVQVIFLSIAVNSHFFPSVELNALKDLYNAANGKNWRWRDVGAQWNFTEQNPNPCFEKWQGVYCTSDCLTGSCNVQNLTLAVYNLVGTLPTSIGNLSQLEILNLNENLIENNIPFQVGNLVHLQQLNFGDNLLQSSVPSSLGNCVNLKSLHLESNLLTGTLPIEIYELTNLADMEFSYNLLAGTISSNVKNLKKLTTFKLDNNQFAGEILVYLSTLTALLEVDLSSNLFNGTIPQAVNTLVNLETLNLYNNGFSGIFPTSLSNLLHATLFSFGNNHFRGTIPSSIGNIPALTELYLQNNFIRGSLPSQLGNLHLLTSLDVSNNALSHTIPQNIQHLKSLTQLSLARNAFVGTFPHVLCHLTNLEALDLNLNEFTGTIPSCIHNFTFLTSFDISNNNFNGTLPKEIGYMHSLQELKINTNRFVGNLPDTIGQLTSLYKLDVTTNRLNGSLPESLYNLSSLQILYLDENVLTGTISLSIHKLQQLKQFYAHNNFLAGTLPPTIGQLPNILYISVSNNQLHGTIPPEIGNLTTLFELNLDTNNFTGSIPPSIGQLANIRLFVAHANSLNGSIPDCIGNLTKLRRWNVNSNYLTGSIPLSVGNLQNIEYFDIVSNLITGTLPGEIFHNFSQIHEFMVGDNYLDGTIPETIGLLRGIRYLDFSLNFFFGQIPDSIGNLRAANDIYLYANSFSGTLPNSIGNCTSLNYFEFYVNHFRGSVPASIANIRDLKAFWLYNNEFTGTLPAALGSMHTMEDFEVEYNYLHGKVPSTLGGMFGLIYLGLNDNHFSGTLPCSIGNMTELLIMTIQNNAISGSLPSSCYKHFRRLQIALLQSNHFTGQIDMATHWKNVTNLNMSCNRFAGSINQLTWKLPFMETFDVSNNFFTGSINNVFDSMPRLIGLNVGHNMFVGNLEAVFVSKGLMLVDVSDNQFTGTLPSSIFALKTLKVFAAVENCLTGTIPSNTICQSTSLATLALDGLHTANECQDRFFPGIPTITSYALKQSLRGTLAPCLFNMTNLKTLHLSANGLTGTIPSQGIRVDSPLVDVSLSYNILTGTVPDWMQERQWRTLDISFNKLNGVLKDTFASPLNTSSLTLTVNRLSGMIPDSLLNANDIDMLKGNIFSCDGTSSLGKATRSLPVSDPEGDTYDCGSDSVNTAMYVWATLVAGVVFCMAAVLFLATITHHQQQTASKQALSQVNTEEWIPLYQRVLNKLHKWKVDFVAWYSLYNNLNLLQLQVKYNSTQASQVMLTQTKLSSLYKLGKSMELIRKLVWFITFYSLCVLLIVYLILSQFYNTHTHVYIWIASAAFLSGFPPAIAIFAFFVLFYVLIGTRLNEFIFKSIGMYKYKDYSHRIPDEKNKAAHDSSRDQSTTTAETNITKAAMSDYFITLQSFSDYLWIVEVIKNWKKIFITEKKEDAEQKKESDPIDWYGIAVRVAIVLLNVAVVMTVNITYVYLITLDLSSTAMAFVEIAVSVFKIIWGGVVVLGIFGNWLSTISKKPVQLKNTDDTKNEQMSEADLMRMTDLVRTSEWWVRRTDIGERMTEAERVTLYNRILKNTEKARRAKFLMLLIIFNNIAAPFLADIFVDPDCFQYLIEAQDPVSVSYDKVSCTDYAFEVEPGTLELSSRCFTTSEATISTSFDPPFVYSYQCTSAILNGFVNVFIYRYLITGLFVPLGSLLIEYLQEHYGISEFFQEIWMLLVEWQRFDDEEEDDEDDVDDDESTEVRDTTIRETQSILDKEQTGHGNGITAQQSVRQPSKILELLAAKIGGKTQKKFKIFRKEAFVIILVGDIAVLLTFGTTFPPLAFVIATAITFTTYFHQMQIGKLFLEIKYQLEHSIPVIYRKTSRQISVALNMNMPHSIPVSAAITKAQLKLLQRKLDSECGDLMELFWPALPVVLMLSAAFIGAFLFDILGDQVGALPALWIFLVSSAIPFILWTIEFMYEQYGQFKKQAAKTAAKSTIDIQMTNNPLFGNETL